MTNLSSSLPELLAALRNNQLSLADYLAELEALFAATEPTLHAFMPEPERFARLAREAEALMGRYPDPATRPALFGLAVGIKDVFHVGGLPTTAGSRLPPQVLHGPEAESVTRLRNAGVLVLGKTVSTEFAYFAPGPTRNPRSPAGTTHTPGGSSSGSAAAVAAGLTPLALGTQTIGSTIRPAAFCGIAGYKPSYDRISRDGLIALAPSFDHVGVLGADVATLVLASAALMDDWRTELDELERPVLGVPEGPYLECASPETRAHFKAVCERLKEAGYQIKHISALTDFETIRERHNLLVAAEAAKVHAQWFKEYRDRYHPKTAELIERGQQADPKAVQTAVLGREKLRRQLNQLMNINMVDLWLTPATVGPAPEGLENTGDPVMNLPWTHCGLPALTLPAGSAPNGLPLGVQFVGRWYGDEELLAWGEEMEDEVSGKA